MPAPALIRAIGRWDLAALTINATIGAGILGLPGHLYALLGVWSLAACLGAGLAMSLVAVCFAEAGSRFSRTGGPSLYADAAFGPDAGFALGWLNLVKGMLNFATVMNLAITYAAALVPALSGGAARTAAILAITCLLSVPVYRGVRLSALAHNGFTVCKLALLLGFVAITAPALLRHGIAPTPLPQAANWPPALILLVFAMGGMESTGISGGEIRDPARSIPFGLGVGIASVVALYSAVIMACQAAVPDLAHSQRPLFDAARVIGGNAGGAAVVLAGVVSMSGVMFVLLFAGPRMVFALAEAGQVPALFGRVHARFRTPAAAVLCHSALAAVLALGTSFLGALAAATVIRLVIYAAIALAVIRLRARNITETEKPLILPGGSAIAAIVAGLCLLLLAQSTRVEFVSLAAVLAIGAGLWAVQRGGVWARR
jgi:APA family basic amino acid/polyamine antiporter